MEYNLFENMGMSGLDLSYVFIVMILFIIALTVLVIILFVKNSKLTKTYRKFMMGKEVKSLETEIADLFDDNKRMKEQISDNRHEIRNLNKQIATVYQKCAILRYDAFKEMGGKLSFCLVLLNENNTGFMLNSVHSSTGCYSYLKEIKEGKCETDLGAEEMKALNMALDGKELA